MNSQGSGVVVVTEFAPLRGCATGFVKRYLLRSGAANSKSTQGRPPVCRRHAAQQLAGRGSGGAELGKNTTHKHNLLLCQGVSLERKMATKAVPRARVLVSTPELAIICRGESVSGHTGARGGPTTPENRTRKMKTSQETNYFSNQISLVI